MMRFKRDQIVKAATDITTAITTIPAGTQVKIYGVDRLFRSYDVETLDGKQEATDVSDRDLDSI